MLRFMILISGLFLAACAPLPGTKSDAQITMMGDSVLAWNRNIGQSVGDALADELRQPVVNFAVSGARISMGDPISGATRFQIENQFDGRSPDWIVLNGGANDLFFECGCLRCGATLTDLVTADGTSGEIPDLLTALRATGAQVMYIGYHRTGGLTSAYEACPDELDIMEARLQTFIGADDGMHFVDMKSVFPPRDRRFYDNDDIHPSTLGSATMAKRLATALRNAGLR